MMTALDPITPVETVLLEAVIPEAPPSDNHLYKTGFHGRRVLSDEGKAYINRVRDVVTKAWIERGMVRTPKDRPLGLRVAVRMPHVFTTTAEAKSKFVKVDTHNRGKLLADAVSKVMGFDDSLHFDVRFTKHEGPSAVYLRVEVLVTTPAWPGGE